MLSHPINLRITACCLAVVTALGARTAVKADTVQLINGDAIRGKVVLLDAKQLVFRSESFGELKIPRDKIELIVLGNQPLPRNHEAAAATPAPSPGAGTGSLIGQVAPLLQSPAAQQQLGPLVQQLMGAGGLGDLQKNVNTARQGLQDLKKDFGPGPESQVLDAYINMFNLFSPSAPATNTPRPRNAPHPVRPSAKSSPKSQPPARQQTGQR
jgi:hypothetical protein